MDRKDLKIEALRQRITELDDKNADYRVEITVLSQENETLKDQVQKLETRLKIAELQADGVQEDQDSEAEAF